MFPESLKHTREVYGILGLLGDLGGVTEVIMICFGFFLYPIAEHSFTLKATSKLFMARTADDNLFSKKVGKYTDELKMPSSAKNDENVMQEIRKHRKIGLKPIDNVLLYLANSFGVCFPSRFWSKQKRL